MKRDYIMKNSTVTILKALAKTKADTTTFTRKEIEAVARDLGFTGKDFYDLISSEFRVRRGVFDLSSVIQTEPVDNVVNMTKQTTMMNEDRHIAEVDENFIPWGNYSDLLKIVKSEIFMPVYVSGLSGNGKTFMIEQACAKLKRECIRVQINPETDEDDLIGGFRLVNGDTVFSMGPVLKAMKNGSVLLLDEIDRGTNKVMCLQGVLEGKPIVIKKTGETIYPAPGFNIIATANTKGRGSEDGRFTAASILDDAFLERFTIAIDQKFASPTTENRILTKLAASLDCEDSEFIENLISWADAIRKTYFDDGVDEVISTRRLCHIIQTYSVFKDRKKSIDLCISRFDEETKDAFLDLYSKVEDPTTQTETYEETL